MIETHPAQPLLELDPDLGQLLTGERLQTAGRDLRAHLVSLEPGVWHPDALCGASAANVGLLVLDGVLAREVSVRDAPSAELFGSGDIIRTWRGTATPELLRTAVRWSALGPASFALMDRHCALALRLYPEVMTVVLDRLNARAERLAVTQAISQITGVEARLEALLWHLAERWGRIGTDGVIVPIALSHRMLGALVGARRPTVSTAVSRLLEEGRAARRPDGTWLLTGTSAPSAPVHEESAFVTRRPARPAHTLAA